MEKGEGCAVVTMASGRFTSRDDRVQSQIWSHRLPSAAGTTADSFLGVVEFGDL